MVAFPYCYSIPKFYDFNFLDSKFPALWTPRANQASQLGQRFHQTSIVLYSSIFHVPLGKLKKANTSQVYSSQVENLNPVFPLIISEVIGLGPPIRTVSPVEANSSSIVEVVLHSRFSNIRPASFSASTNRCKLGVAGRPNKGLEMMKITHWILTKSIKWQLWSGLFIPYLVRWRDLLEKMAMMIIYGCWNIFGTQ